VRSQLFDSAFILAGTNVRFGIEALLRLVPGKGMSRPQRYRRICFVRLIGWKSLGTSSLGWQLTSLSRVWSERCVGDFFDVGFKANRRNLQILRSYFEEQGLI
jgi:hypothetical protein